MSLNDSLGSPDLEVMHQKLQAGMLPAMTTNFVSPLSLINSELFPDLLHHYSTENSRLLFSTLAELNNPSLVNKKGTQGGYTALAWMCIKNEIELIEFLISKCKADVNTKANLGETPLFICIKNCNIYTIELLIEHGADLQARDIYNRSLIHWSAYTGRVILFHYFQKYHLIENFNDIDQFQQNALHIAAASGFAELVHFLIDSGDINLFAQDINGNTIMHMAAKSGMSRTCWLIAQKNRGECIRLINFENKQKQKPYDLIRNEKGPQFKKIREWLRVEARTNELLDKNVETTIYEKKSDDFVMPSKFPTQKLFSFLPSFCTLNYNSYRQAYTEWLARLTCFFILLTIPQIVNRILFDPKGLSAFKGMIAYGSLVAIVFAMTKQKHRIDHINGWENPFYLGYFLAVFIHNYVSYYTIVIPSFSITNFYDVLSVLLTVGHFYSFYLLMNTNPGFIRENLKKSDGSSYGLRDLLNINRREKARSTKDSINWLTEPSSNTSNYYQPYFCESCLIVASIPSKHCKLCESCCSKFDHHCLFINKCVGLKNHRPFMLFVMFTISCTVYYLINVYEYFVNFANDLEIKNLIKSSNEKISLFYYMFASNNQIWLTVLVLINSTTVIMVSFLLYMQMKFVSIGFTSQFQPPIFFVDNSKKMNSLLNAFCHRLQNLKIFFFQSYESNEELYYQQMSDYNLNSLSSNRSIPMGYPRNENFDNNVFLQNNPNNSNNNKNLNNFSNGKSHEIELD